MKFGYAEMDTPIGRIAIAATSTGLCSLEFDSGREEVMGRIERRFGAAERDDAIRLDPYIRSLDAFMSGDLHAIDSVAVETAGTPFQRRVWARLRRIQAGGTRSYGALARELGIPGGARAVGLANGSNPVAIVVPCHRVIAADGTLGGYGGGLDRKRWLLAHEGVKMRDSVVAPSLF
jgi:O-6-methylguanine DNA methyltransferase